MLEVSHVLDRLKIRRSHITFAVQDIGLLVQESKDPIYTASHLFNQILSVPVRFDDKVHARIAVKSMIRDVMLYKCSIDNDDVQDIVSDAITYADNYRADPKNSYLWAKPDEDEDVVQEVQTIAGCEQKVAVREDGKIKKGGKQILAAELYNTHIKNNPTPMSNKEYIQLLMSTLDMTINGATTYAYNQRKAHKLELAENK